VNIEAKKHRLVNHVVAPRTIGGIFKLAYKGGCMGMYNTSDMGPKDPNLKSFLFFILRWPIGGAALALLLLYLFG